MISAIERRTVPRGGAPQEGGLHLALFEAWTFGGEPPYVAEEGAGPAIFRPDLVAAARMACAACESPAFMTFFGGNAHLILGLMRRSPPFDFVMPGVAQGPPDPDTDLLPLRYVQSALDDEMGPYLRQLGLLRQAVEERICAFAPPPPIGDDSFVIDRLDPYFAYRWTRRELSPATLRSKMWLLQTAVQRQFCARHGVELIEPPPDAWTVDGFMAPACYGQDATHGGPHYGELVLRQIEVLCGAPMTSWSTFSVKDP